MQIVIDIPEYIYKLCQGHGDIVYKYIDKGTPLPKGHGRLIDVSKLNDVEIYDRSNDMYGASSDQIWNAETIIEADKEG